MFDNGSEDFKDKFLYSVIFLSDVFFVFKSLFTDRVTKET